MLCPEEKESRKPVRLFQRGYTLVELMVVVTVIMVLSTIGMFAYKRAIAYAKETVCKTNLETLVGVIEKEKRWEEICRKNGVGFSARITPGVSSGIAGLSPMRSVGGIFSPG